MRHTKYKILIIDDEPDFREMIALAIQKNGYETETAENGDIGKFHMQLQDYDLIISDISMPVTDGREVLRFVKNHKSTPVILITGNVHIDAAEVLQTWQADGFLLKPFPISSLLEKIKAVLLKHQKKAS